MTTWPHKSNNNWGNQMTFITKGNKLIDATAPRFIITPDGLHPGLTMADT